MFSFAQFPGLVNGATIDWFLPWPEDALTAVAGRFIDSFAMACTDQVHIFRQYEVLRRRS